MAQFFPTQIYVSRPDQWRLRNKAEREDSADLDKLPRQQLAKPTVTQLQLTKSVLRFNSFNTVATRCCAW